jgi:hypothetical protein
MDWEGEVHLCFFATKYIKAGTELRYYYGKTSGTSWRCLVSTLNFLYGLSFNDITPGLFVRLLH